MPLFVPEINIVSLVRWWLHRRIALAWRKLAYTFFWEMEPCCIQEIVENLLQPNNDDSKVWAWGVGVTKKSYNLVSSGYRFLICRYPVGFPQEKIWVEMLGFV